MKYPMTGTVERVVTDKVTIVVEADTESDAFMVARRVLNVFPEAHDQDGVLHCRIEEREYIGTSLTDLIIERELRELS